MIYLYRRNKTGICIDRVFGNDGIVEVPEMLEGLLVTELGAYVFSDHVDRKDLESVSRAGTFVQITDSVSRMKMGCRRYPEIS